MGCCMRGEGEGAGEGRGPGWATRFPGTAASAALAVALAAAVCSTSCAVLRSTRSETFFRMKWNSCSTAFSCAAYTLDGPTHNRIAFHSRSLFPAASSHWVYSPFDSMFILWKQACQDPTCQDPAKHGMGGFHKSGQCMRRLMVSQGGAPE